MRLKQGFKKGVVARQLSAAWLNAVGWFLNTIHGGTHINVVKPTVPCEGDGPMVELDMKGLCADLRNRGFLTKVSNEDDGGGGGGGGDDATAGNLAAYDESGNLVDSGQAKPEDGHKFVQAAVDSLPKGNLLKAGDGDNIEDSGVKAEDLMLQDESDPYLKTSEIDQLIQDALDAWDGGDEPGTPPPSGVSMDEVEDAIASALDGLTDDLDGMFVEWADVGVAGGVAAYGHTHTMADLTLQIAGHSGTCYVTVGPDGKLGHSGNAAFGLLADAADAGATALITDVDVDEYGFLLEEDIGVTVAPAEHEHGYDEIVDGGYTLADDLEDILDEIDELKTPSAPKGTRTLASGFSGLISNFANKQGGTFTAGEIGGQGIVVKLCCRGADGGENGTVFWRPFTITSDGRIYKIEAESDAMGVYTDQ